MIVSTAERMPTARVGQLSVRPDTFPWSAVGGPGRYGRAPHQLGEPPGSPGHLPLVRLSADRPLRPRTAPAGGTSRFARTPSLVPIGGQTTTATHAPAGGSVPPDFPGRPWRDRYARLEIDQLGSAIEAASPCRAELDRGRRRSVEKRARRRRTACGRRRSSGGSAIAKPPRVWVAPLAERDHLLREGLDGLGLRLGRLDPPVGDQRPREVRVEGLPMRRVAAELLSRASVAHG